MQGCRVKSTILLVLSLIFISFFGYTAAQKVYSWKDENGVLVFSDTPRPGATEVKLNTQNLTMPATDTSILDTASATPVNFKVSISTHQKMKKLFEKIQAQYMSQHELAHVLKQDFKVQLFVDGSPHGAPSNSTTFALREVFRGEHTLQAKLYDANNKLVSVSPVSTFFMHRTSINNGN